MGNPDPTAVARHEAVCRHCCKCCFTKVIVNRRVHLTPFPCEHLDLGTRTCRIYSQRFELNKECLDVERGLRFSAFPAGCPYVALKAGPGYKPALEDWTWAGQWDDFDNLADDLDVPEAIREMIRARGPDARPLYEFPGEAGKR